MPVVRPASDVAAGGWITDQGSSTGLAARLSESTPDDATAILSPVSPGGAACVIALGALAVDPPNGTCTLRYHFGKDALGGERIDERVELLDQDGVTVLQTWLHTDVGIAPQSAAQAFTANLAPGAYSIRLTAWAVRTGALAGVLPALIAAGTGTAPATSATAYRVTPATLTPAAGAADVITAQLVDGGGNAVAQAGRVVTWSKTGGGSFSAPTSTTNGSGVATVTLTCPTVTGTQTVSGSDGTCSGTSATISVVAGPLSVARCTLVAVPASLPADGSSTALLTLWACDAYGNPFTGSAGTWVPATDAGSLAAVANLGNGSQTVLLTAGSSIVTASITGTLAGQALAPLSVPLTDPGAVAFTVTPSAHATQGAVSLNYTVTPGPSITLATIRADLFDAYGLKVIPGASSLPTVGTVNLGWRLPGGAYTPQMTATDAGGQKYTWSGPPVTVAARPSSTVTVATGTPDITIDTQQHYQTWRGHEAVAQIGLDMGPTVQNPTLPLYATWAPFVKDQAWEAFRDIGVTRLRTEIRGQTAVRPSTQRPQTSPSDPDFAEFDQKMTEIILPMRAAYLAAGLDLPYVVNYSDYARSYTSGIGTNSTLYAQMVLAFYNHIIASSWPLPQGWQVWNEPDNSTPITSGGGAVLGAHMTAVDALFKAQTPVLATPAFIFSGFFYATTVGGLGGLKTWWNQLTTAQQALVKELSFHRYQPIDSDQNLQPNYTAALDEIGALSAATGLPTTQSEADEGPGGGAHPSPNAVWRDLTHGNVSAWSFYALAYGTVDDSSAAYFYDLTSATNPVLQTTAREHLLRQFFRHLKPGAVRVAATTASGVLRPIAFQNPDGSLVVAVDHATNGPFSVGLAPGSYAGGEYGIFLNTGSVAAAPDGLFAPFTLTAGQVAVVNPPVNPGFDNTSVLVGAPGFANNEPAGVGLQPIFHQMGDKQTVDLFGNAGAPGAKWNAISPVGIPYVEVVKDSRAPFGRASELRWIYDNANGDTEGIHGCQVDFTSWGGFAAAGLTRQYVRWVVMMSPQWVGHSGGDKLGYFWMGVAAGNGPQQHWLVFRGNGPYTNPESAYERSLYPPTQLTISTQGGSNIFPTAKTMPCGQYHVIETYSVAASAPGVADGQFTQWIDGTLTAQNVAVNWSDYFTKFTGFKHDPFWGGNRMIGGVPTPEFKHETAPGVPRQAWPLRTYDYLRFGEIYISGA